MEQLETYIITRIRELENENRRLKEENTLKDLEFRDLRNIIRCDLKARIVKDDDGSEFIRFDSLWPGDPAFQYIKGLLNE